MNQCELFLLSPYRVPAKDSVYLGDEDVAAFLNGYIALWHPILAAHAAEPPRIVSPYDHENPTSGHIYAVPETPPMFLPDDWEQRVREAGACFFRSTPDRATTLANLEQALRDTYPDLTLPGLAHEQLAPFFGIGFGYMHLCALFEAMDHDNLISTAEFQQDVKSAASGLLQADIDVCRAHLQSAADRLMSARESLYSVGVHVVDICLLNDQPLPAAFSESEPLNIVASAVDLESFTHAHEDIMSKLRERVQAEQLEICVGCYREREDALLPLESQLWNLQQGLAQAREILGTDVRVYARKQLSPIGNMPQVLASAGIHRALLLSFDESSAPSYRSTMVSWPTSDGRQIDVFTRTPYRSDTPQTFFHLAHYLHQTIAQDFAATLALLHGDKPAAPWYDDWLQLTRLAPILGKWTTLTNYCNEVTCGEQASMSTADEFQNDYLTRRTESLNERPVSWFASHARQRRRIDTLHTLAALYRGLVGRNDLLQISDPLRALEARMEQDEDCTKDSAALQQTIMQAIADRLLSRATQETPGFLVVNPCSFTRRVVLELDDVSEQLALDGPVKGCQINDGKARVIVEVPALGFAWFPRQGTSQTASAAKRMRLADDTHVRNEFFEASIDPVTGGLRSIWDHKTHMSRLGQQLVFNPGSTMRASSVKVASTGPALGEVVSEGAILDEHEKVLAKFRQRFRAWVGRPLLELRIEVYPEHTPQGYPWHAYYGSRFAWRDERALMLRGVNGSSSITSHTRPESPDYIEWRLGRSSTVLFPSGLPFHQRHGARMLDVILVPAGEKCQVFDLAIAMDREQPMQTALGLITPAPYIQVAKGPPHVGATGWLYHLDAPNLMLTSLRADSEGGDAIIARLQECAMHATSAELRCVRNPISAQQLNLRGEFQTAASVSGDAAIFEVAAGDFVQLRVEFS